MNSLRPSIVSLLAVLPLACFNPPEQRDDPQGTTTDVTMIPSTSDSTGEPPGATSIDPDAGSSGPVADDTTTTGDDTTTSTPGDSSSDGGESSSSGDPPAGVCGDGVLDVATEGCDDGNVMDGDLCSSACQPETLTFVFTGGPQNLMLPPWVDGVFIEAWGAQGGGSICCAPDPAQEDGGLGGYASGTVNVPMGANLIINVGGQGTPKGPGGFGGGGTGGQWGAGGGGASDVRIGGMGLPNRVLTAGGGGGGNCGCPDHGAGGGGGGLSGQVGISGQGLTPGGGGTQMAGGSAGQDGTPGQLGLGGSTATGDLYHFAGGGGGHYGGGGAYASGGGGGSSYIGMSGDGVTMPAMRMGNGEVTITPVQNP